MRQKYHQKHITKNISQSKNRVQCVSFGMCVARPNEKNPMRSEQHRGARQRVRTPLRTTSTMKASSWRSGPKQGFIVAERRQATKLRQGWGKELTPPEGTQQEQDDNKDPTRDEGKTDTINTQKDDRWTGSRWGAQVNTPMRHRKKNWSQSTGTKDCQNKTGEDQTWRSKDDI